MSLLTDILNLLCLNHFLSLSFLIWFFYQPSFLSLSLALCFTHTHADTHKHACDGLLRISCCLRALFATLITKTGGTRVCVPIFSICAYYKKQLHLTQATEEGQRGCYSNMLFRWLSGDGSRESGMERWDVLQNVRRREMVERRHIAREKEWKCERREQNGEDRKWSRDGVKKEWGEFRVRRLGENEKASETLPSLPTALQWNDHKSVTQCASHHSVTAKFNCHCFCTDSRPVTIDSSQEPLSCVLAIKEGLTPEMLALIGHCNYSFCPSRL